MKEITIEIYQFDELNYEAKEVAINWAREVDLNTDYEWYDGEFEFWTDKLAEQGFENAKIYFNGFWSQGDGACFDADINWEKYIKFHKLEDKYADLIKYIKETLGSGHELEMIFKIEKNSYGNHYSHERTRFVECSSFEEDWDTRKEKENYNRASELCDELEKELESSRLDLSKELYKDLNNTYDGLNSDESLIDTIKANEYEFTADGKRY